MTYKDYMTGFVGQSGQVEYIDGRYEITYYNDISRLSVTDDKCELTDSLNQSICDSVPGIKTSLDSNECKIVEVHDDFLIIEYAKRKVLSKVSVPFSSLTISVIKS
jgi:hypothetical protein